ncbi:uncharacterized protein FIBRA_09277 [Fibroporia radiculosa]|uniref:Uncharacterized protein n=1 Tax=Fibroporia radiculosa TaxID=599839 RepID=J7SCW2_9APHY|nr:uncharacterized protein FIBRA_09277 [Fibroporia radiculosa]CCM06963.1 predicted protein [Fibroporia radiculosa]
MSGLQRVPTPYPSHLQTLEECFTAGIIEMPVPIRPILSFPSHQESDDSSLEFLEDGGFRYPIAPLTNVTHQPFLIPNSSDSSTNNTVVLHQFPGPLEVPQNTSEASTGTYHGVPIQFFTSSSPMNVLSSPDPDHPPAESLTPDSPSMPPLASNASDNGSLAYAPNLQLLANVSKYIMASEGGHSSDPQEFVIYSDKMIQCPNNNVTRMWQTIPFNTSTPIQDVDPLEQVMPHFPRAYTHSVSQPPMGVPINTLRTTDPVGNWNSSDKEWEEDTWEYLLMQDNNLLESLWALLQDIRDPGVIDKADWFRAVNAKIGLLLAAQRSIGAKLLHTEEEMSQC